MFRHDQDLSIVWIHRIQVGELDAVEGTGDRGKQPAAALIIDLPPRCAGDDDTGAGGMSRFPMVFIIHPVEVFARTGSPQRSGDVSCVIPG
jgi:hypothetical protein